MESEATLPDDIAAQWFGGALLLWLAIHCVAFKVWGTVGVATVDDTSAENVNRCVLRSSSSKCSRSARCCCMC